MKKILLHKSIIFRTSLSHKKAVVALKLASENPAADFINFYITRSPTERGWTLAGRVRSLTEVFLKSPEKFVIEV